MNLAFFYKENIGTANKLIIFDEETSKHIVQVLRMKIGEQLQVTDGKGNLITAEIVNDHKKKCEVRIIDTQSTPSSSRKITIAISLLKNPGRFEWFLEKATELGIAEIIPLICERTEKQHFRYERMKNICISAMLQSQQVWLPGLHQPIKFISLFDKVNHDQKFIAHCVGNQKENLVNLIKDDLKSRIVLIGPEGDFSENEIELARSQFFLPVSLSKTRLRTETAGIVAATILSTM